MKTYDGISWRKKDEYAAITRLLRSRIHGGRNCLADFGGRVGIYVEDACLIFRSICEIHYMLNFFRTNDN